MQPKYYVDLTHLPEMTNETFFPLFQAKERYLILWGASGSGKSVFAAQKVVRRTIEEPFHKFLVVRKVAKTIRHSVFAEIINIISSWGLNQASTKLFKINKTDLEIACVNGNQIIFAGMDDPEKLKSISGITSVWVEEGTELEKEDFQQIDLRLRGQTRSYRQIMLSFNPISITHWLKDYFELPHNPQEHIHRPREGVLAHHSTYKDNRFIDEQYKKVLEDLKGVDEYYYTVYALGLWGVLGKSVYNSKAVTERLQAVSPPLATGTFIYEEDVSGKIRDETIQLVEEPNGYLKIYEHPQPGFPYVIGGDVAEGGTNFSVLSVRNNVTLNQAAVWRGQTDTDLYAKQAYCLGKHYNTALLSIEANFDLHSVKELERLNYPKQYIREAVDSFTGKTLPKYGFLTTKASRPLIIGKHVAFARENMELFNDEVTLSEMLTFVRDENGRPAAQAGKFDDAVMADAICLGSRDQQTLEIEAAPVQKKELPWPFREEQVNEEQQYMGW